MTRKINKSDVILLVPRKHWRQLRDQLDLVVQEDRHNGGTEWQEIVESILRLPDRTAEKIKAQLLSEKGEN